MPRRAQTLSLYHPWFSDSTLTLVLVFGVIRELLKEHYREKKKSTRTLLVSPVGVVWKKRWEITPRSEVYLLMGEKVMELEEQTAEEAGRRRRKIERQRKKIYFGKERKTEGALAKQQHTTAALMCFSLPGENSGDVHSSSSPQTHPVFTQRLAHRRRLAVRGWPTCSFLWVAEHNRPSAERERDRRLQTLMHNTSLA